MTRSIDKALKKPPLGTIHVRDGRVQSVEKLTLWNGILWKTIEVRREGRRFSSEIGHPRYRRARVRYGTLKEVLSGLHPAIRQRYISLFRLRKATPQRIETAGFEGYEIIKY